MNKWGIPEWLENEVRDRDKTCVYCGIKMIEKMPPKGPRKTVATWEHIINSRSAILRMGKISFANKPLKPIAARGAAPAQLFVR